MQTDNRAFDAVARLFTNAAGAAQSLRTEIEAIVKSRIEQIAADLDLVPREEFETVRRMAAEARMANEKLAARIADLEQAMAKKESSGT